MVHDEIENDADPARLGVGLERVEIGQRAVLRRDVLVIADVVAEVHLGRGIAGGDPDGVDAQVVEVIEVLGDSLEIAEAVVVRVTETAGIDLVEDGVLPPGMSSGVPRRRSGTIRRRLRFGAAGRHDRGRPQRTHEAHAHRSRPFDAGGIFTTTLFRGIVCVPTRPASHCHCSPSWLALTVTRSSSLPRRRQAPS